MYASLLGFCMKKVVILVGRDEEKVLKRIADSKYDNKDVMARYWRF